MAPNYKCYQVRRKIPACKKQHKNRKIQRHQHIWKWCYSKMHLFARYLSLGHNCLQDGGHSRKLGPGTIGTWDVKESLQSVKREDSEPPHGNLTDENTAHHRL